jgi:signal transduction histidine kinase
MIERAFQHRSGRVISLGRLILAAVSLLAISLDPTQPAQYPTSGYTILLLYSLWAAAILLLTWRNWWLDYRLAAATLAVDVSVFGLLVLLTEGYTSPFFTFFIFVVMAAAIRWGWRETALTATVVILMFYGGGFAALAWGNGQFELQGFLIRGTYLLVLSLLLTWFGINQQVRGPAQPRFMELEEGIDPESPPIASAMEHAATRTGAKRIVLVWWDKEEPWTHVAELAGGNMERHRFGPGEIEPPFSDASEDRPLLFDQRNNRSLGTEKGRPQSLLARRQAINSDFASRFRIESGLAISIRSGDYEGELFALGVPGLCSDDLKVGDQVGREISSALDRFSAIAASEEGAVARARLSLARDLHDSVVQVLAGASFQLEAVRKRMRAGEEIDSAIAALQEDLGTEQRNLRGYIARLGAGRGSSRPVDFSKGMDDLTARISRQWGVRCAAFTSSDGIQVSAWAEHELHQLVREAAANAVRHGKASAVTIELSASRRQLHLSIADNGGGFPVHGEFDERGLHEQKLCPMSLHERIKHLGGTLSLVSSPVGSRLSMAIPLELIA